MNILDILNELNESNSTLYKIETLEKYKDNELFKRVLAMTYDRVTYTYGVTMKNVPEYTAQSGRPISLNSALDILQNDLATRKVTGNKAIGLVHNTLSNLSNEDSVILERILGRDLKVNIGKTQVNKIFKGLCVKPVYMRCDVYGEKTSKNIKFPALVELKADGTYRSVTVENGEVTFNSRSGEEYEYPLLKEQFSKLQDGVYTGELTVTGLTNRAESNGLINSLTPPHDRIIIELWDYISPEEFSNAANKVKNKTPYSVRFNALKSIIKESENIKIIPYKEVHTLKEALQQTSEWMNEGYEGAILKDLNGVFRDGTSKEQLKLKLEIDLEVRVIGFQDGTPGTKREGKVGSLIFANDEGTIKGRCSGFTDKELDDFTENKDKILNKIITVQFNDLTKAIGNDFYALSHPRFICIRHDKDETDTLERAFQLRDMAMELK